MSDVTAGTELPTIEQQSDPDDVGRPTPPRPGTSTPSTTTRASPARSARPGGIIAHGMYSMGLASRLLTQFAGGPESVLEIAVRFAKPWPLGSTSTFGGTVTEVQDGVATVELFADNENGERILKGTGRVRL